VKTDVEELSPTRVRLTVEVPFDELKPSLDQAYREVARQVRVPGFRPGRVPPRIIDQRFGRASVLEQAVNDAVPQLYGKALAEHDVIALGQPELEITKLDDGQQLAFTAEVDVRPNFELPELDGLPVTVDDADVSPDDVEEYLGTLRERFASLKGASRPAQDGDFVSIDVAATVGGKQVEDAQDNDISYQVGSGLMIEGLDEALRGMSAGETKTFSAELSAGRQAGQQAEVAVTVHSVKVKEMPELDDEFAQSASEFDTIGELRADTRKQLEAVRRAGQAGQARERALDALLDRVDIPLPERVIDAELAARRQSLTERLDRSGSTLESYLEAVGKTDDQFEAELAEEARRSVQAGFILDKLAAEEKIGVDEPELTGYVTEQAYRLGVPPDQLARQLTDRGQLSAMIADILRSKALSLVAERANVTDATGRKVDLSPPAADGDTAAEPAADAGESAAEGGADADSGSS
jgi:trigger factor